MSQPIRKFASKLIRLFIPGCARLEQHYSPRKLESAGDTSTNQLNQYPRISIVIPSYNQGCYLGETLKSLVQQKYPALEIIVVDGGSADNSVEIIKAYEKVIKWWVSEADKGQANAINKGMKHASGEILAWLNSDDCLMPNALFRIAEKFQSSKSTDVVYGHRVLINKNGLDVGRWIMPAHRNFILNYVDYIPQETMFWRAELWHKIGAYVDESFQFALDWELICRFILAGAKFKLLPVFLGQFRMHALQKTQANIEVDGFKEMEIIREQCRQRYSTNRVLLKVYFYRQRLSIYSFLLRARLTELFWQLGLKKID